VNSAIDVVVCSFCRNDTWRPLLESVRRQLRGDDRVVVVVDQLRPDVEEVARDLGLILVQQKGRGLSDARNSGLAATRAPIVAFLDDDVELEAGWAEALRRAMEDPSVAMAVGRITGPSSPYPASWSYYSYDLGSTRRPVRYPIGANMAVRGDLGRRLGFDAAFRAGFDEWDFAERLRAEGGQIMFDPSFAVYNHHRTRLGALWRQQRTYGRSEVRFRRRHRTGPFNKRTWAWVIALLGLAFAPFLGLWSLSALVLPLVASLAQAVSMARSPAQGLRLWPLSFLVSVAQAMGNLEGLLIRRP